MINRDCPADEEGKIKKARDERAKKNLTQIEKARKRGKQRERTPYSETEFIQEVLGFIAMEKGHLEQDIARKEKSNKLLHSLKSESATRTINANTAEIKRAQARFSQLETAETALQNLLVKVEGLNRKILGNNSPVSFVDTVTYNIERFSSNSYPSETIAEQALEVLLQEFDRTPLEERTMTVEERIQRIPKPTDG
jgi:hypothetical protein